MKIKRTGDLVHVTYPSQESLAKAFCRMQEHYESPKFRGEIFTLGQLRSWYSQNHGAWTYYQDWNGFNFPSSVLDLFKQGMFDPLSLEEAELFEALRYIPGKFYIIGTHPGSDSDVVPHEELHALYYANEPYRREIEAVLDCVFPANLSRLKNHLRELGYHEAVIQDEVHAYLGASTAYLQKEGIEYPKGTAETIKQIARNYGWAH